MMWLIYNNYHIEHYICRYILANLLSVEVMYDNLVLTEMIKPVTLFNALAQ